MAMPLARLHSLLARHAPTVRAALKQADKYLQQHLPVQLRKAQVEAQPILARARQPLHPVAALRQSKGRWYTTHSANTAKAFARRFTSDAAAKPGAKFDRSSFPKSRIGTIINQSTGRAPFASTLRPNLTGGTLGRTAGGYGFGGGSARYFSHTPAAPAQVVQNVSQAVRAFFISGQKAQYDGINSRTGEKRYKAVSTLQKNVTRKLETLPKSTPGSYVDFAINPTITALTPLSSIPGFPAASASCAAQAHAVESINTDGLLDVLSADFSRALKDLAIVLNDLQRLASLGDLPISYRTSSLRVHFPGCDEETVVRICDELGIRRGVIVQDEDFDAFAGTEIALLFPFAPSKTTSESSFYEKPVEERYVRRPNIDWEAMLSNSEGRSSIESDDGHSSFEDVGKGNPWLSSPSGYESCASEYEAGIEDGPLEYQGFEGVWRFMEQCEAR